MIQTDKMRRGGPASAWGGSGKGFKDRKGFTLLELMIVGVVLGILAGIAIPVYLTYLKRAKQVEAPVTLTEINRLEGMHFAFSGVYGKLEEIGFHPGPTHHYYHFTLETTPGAGGRPAGFKATATANLDSDDEEDIWTISQDGILNHPGVD